MNLFKKLQVLAGALVRAPLAPRREKAGPGEPGGPAGPQPEQQGTHGQADREGRRDRSHLEAQEPGVVDTERVADLLAKKRQEEQD